MGIATMKVPTIFTAIDRFSSVVDKMTGKTARFGNTASAAAMRTSARMNSLGTTMLTVGTIMAGGIGLAVNEAIKFEKSMANVSTTIDSTPALMRKMSDEVLNMSKKIPIPISQLTEALYDVVSAGIDAKYSMTVLGASGRLAVAGLGTAQESVDILTSSINAFNIKATDAESIANDVFKAVKYGKVTVSALAESFGNNASLLKNSNVSLKEYLATTAVLTTTGMSASRAQTQVSSAVTALIKPNKLMSKIFNQLGVRDIPLFIKKNGDIVKTLEIVTAKAKEMGILTSSAFGRKEGLNATLSLLGPLRAKYNEVMTDMTGTTDTLTASFEKQKKTTAANIQLLKNNVTTLAIKLGDALLPRIIAFTNRVIPLVDRLGSWIKKNTWLVDTIFKVTAGLLVLGGILKVGSVLFYGISKAITLCTFVTRTYSAVMLTAALSGQGLVATMGAMTLAAAGPILPILAIGAALAGLIYMFSNTSKAMDDFTLKRVDNLNKGNTAWKYSTFVLRDELNKQRDLINKSKSIVGIEAASHKTNVDLNNLYDKPDPMKTPAMAKLQSGFKIPQTSNKLSNSPLNALSVNTKSDRMLNEHNQVFGIQPAPKNLAGNDNKATNGKGSIGTNNVLKVIVDAKNGAQAEIDDSQMQGISVRTSSTKKAAEPRYFLPNGF